MGGFQWREIPNDIIVDILSRLPVKSLIRFRCVCKHWFSLSFDKQFIDLHLERAKQDTGFIISNLERSDQHYCEQDFFTFDRDGNPIHKFKFGTEAPWKGIEALLRYRYMYHVLPSCNGLVCFYGMNCIYICNPNTHEIESLPQNSASRFACGFGFDPLSKKYKVIKVTKPIGCRRARYFHISYCEVLTVGEETWRDIGNAPFTFVGDPIFVKGFIHWRVSDAHQGHELIVSFDVGAEKFGVIPHPECLSLKKRGYLSLLELGECLCVLDQDFEDKKIKDLWILKDYTKNIWVKERIVLPFELKSPTYPVAMLNGEILLHTVGIRLDAYNIQHKSFRKLDFEGLELVNFSISISNHVGSLTLLREKQCSW